MTEKSQASSTLEASEGVPAVGHQKAAFASAADTELGHAQSTIRELQARSEVFPAENMALTVALSQLRRGDTPTPNVAAVCIFALARLAGRPGYERKCMELSGGLICDEPFDHDGPHGYVDEDTFANGFGR